MIRKADTELFLENLVRAFGEVSFDISGWNTDSVFRKIHAPKPSGSRPNFSLSTCSPGWSTCGSALEAASQPFGQNPIWREPYEFQLRISPLGRLIDVDTSLYLVIEYQNPPSLMRSVGFCNRNRVFLLGHRIPHEFPQGVLLTCDHSMEFDYKSQQSAFRGKFSWQCLRMP